MWELANIFVVNKLVVLLINSEKCFVHNLVQQFLLDVAVNISFVTSVTRFSNELNRNLDHFLEGIMSLMYKFQKMMFWNERVLCSSSNWHR